MYNGGPMKAEGKDRVESYCLNKAVEVSRQP